MTTDAADGRLRLRTPFDLHDGPPILPLISPRESDRIAEVFQALSAAGVVAVEVTLRHAGAIEALRRAAASAPPGMIVGVGTVRTISQIDEAVAAGAAFVVSPGFDERLAARAAERHVPYVPGVATPTEVMAAAGLGLNVLKFFPAETMGGAAALSALVEPFPDIAFIPTGGIGEANLARYLALPNVWCCGGSWIAPPAELTRGEVSAIAVRVDHARAIATSIEVERANRPR